MVIMKKTILILLALFSFFWVGAQNASVTSGCIPLEVNFSTADLSEYYWVFGDNSSSDLQNPDHIFTTAGVFKVELFEGVNGTKIGELEITVYPDPIIEINASETQGCSPLQVDFSPNITIDPALTIDSYLWTFGDGNSSTAQNPSHIFQNAGKYTISLAIKTNLLECDKTEIFTDYITVDGVESKFILNKIADCEAPATFVITNQTDNNSNYEYFWDFGNGDDFMGYDPGTVTFNEEGTYTISLTVMDENGCESTQTRTVYIGAPNFNINVMDACINSPITIVNNTSATNFNWDFGPNASPSSSTDQSPTVSFNSPGPQTINLSITNQFNCMNDTSFVIDIQDPTAEFTIDPPITDCTEPTNLTIEALESGYANYEWNINTDNVSSFMIAHEWPERDSLHLHFTDSLLISLTVTTNIGCEASYETYFTQRKPDAYFTVNTAKGCAPLEIQFTDDSRSKEDIVSWKYIYGNGDEDILIDPTDHSYTFQNPGEYYTRLVIENDAGCIDTSAGLWILVGEPIPSDYVLDKTEICLGDTVQIELTNMDDRIDAWHATTDNNRFQHCWMSPSASHTFVHEPGNFSIQLETEYNGCYWSETISETIQVNGAKSNISWMTNCENPYDVMLTSQSKGASSLSWTIEEPDQYQQTSFTHSFDTKGIKKIYLEAFDDSSSCPSSLDSAEIHIVEIQAAFDLPETVCDNEAYELDAINSVDVNETCHKGYLWKLPYNRPRELGDSKLDINFPITGYQEITLIVEDINGCTDTLTKGTTSYGINASFESSSTNICLPATVDFQDLSTSDTTITQWDWSFGSDETNPSFEFTTTDNNPGIEVILSLTDAVGCTESISKTIAVYEVTSNISIDNGPGICVGEEITFSASDFTSQGSFLHYEWDFESFGTSMNQSETILFDDSGMINVVLEYTEDQSGCSGTAEIPITVVQVPVADFSTSVDDLEEICHPAIIEFNNTSQWEGFVNHFWDFGNGIGSNEVNPFNSFPKGTHEVELIVRSVYGCSDTISKTYTLVGPEGDMFLDKNSICKGESITFSLENPIDVNEYIWVFGDGTVEENVSPIEHFFDFNPPGGETKVDLILKSVENGCEFIITEPIYITEILADFDFIDSSYCEGLAIFENKSVGAVDNFVWDFGNGSSSTEYNPSIIYDDLGNYTVTLRVSDAQNICNDEISKEISIEEVADFIFFPNVFTPNNDNQNDYFNVAVLPGYEDVVEVKTFKVYNRWGNQLYDNDNPSLGWDGMDNNAPAPATVYAYFIEVEITDCNNKVQKGNVTIIR